LKAIAPQAIIGSAITHAPEESRDDFQLGRGVAHNPARCSVQGDARLSARQPLGASVLLTDGTIFVVGTAATDEKNAGHQDAELYKIETDA
jgi:hypothetical protein